MSKRVVIRGFRPEDLEVVHEVEGRSFPDAWSKDQLMSSYGSPQTYFLVAVLESEVVGYIIGRVEQSLEGRFFFGSRKLGHILNIAVIPELRRSGMGTRLMMSLEDLFRIEEVERVKLEVRASNIGAQKFYEELGYEKKRTALLYYGDEDGIIMEKRLR